MQDAKKSKVEFSLQQIQTNPVTRKQLEGFIEEVVLLQQKIKSDKEGIKDIVTEAKDQLGVPPRVLMKLVRENMQPGSIEAEVHELEEVQLLADTLANKQP